MAVKRTSLMMCLIRCGETTWARDGRLAGSTDLPMSSTGRASVAADVQRLAACRATVVHHPTDEAAVTTAELFASHFKIKKRGMAQLADADLGVFEGLTEQEVGSRYPRRSKLWRDDPLRLHPPQGEPVLDARARLLSTIVKILRRTKDEEVAVVLHPLNTALLQCWLANRPTEKLWDTLKSRPRIERYTIASGLLDDLEQLARTTT